MMDGVPETAVALCLAILSIVVDMLQYCDDSNGVVGDVINGSLGRIDEAVSVGRHKLSDCEQQNLFSVIMKESQYKRYNVGVTGV
jgi:hypothetical protein